MAQTFGERTLAVDGFLASAMAGYEARLRSLLKRAETDEERADLEVRLEAVTTVLENAEVYAA